MIRKAILNDANKLSSLLSQMGYFMNEEEIKEKIQILSSSSDDMILVWEEEGEVKAFISVHFFTQLALKGDFLRINYFCVDSAMRGKGIGAKMLEYVENEAKKRGCFRIELHSSYKRKKAHIFYKKHGYFEYPKYFVKIVNENDPLFKKIGGKNV